MAQIRHAFRRTTSKGLQEPGLASVEKKGTSEVRVKAPDAVRNRRTGACARSTGPRRTVTHDRACGGSGCPVGKEGPEATQPVTRRRRVSRVLLVLPCPPEGAGSATRTRPSEAGDSVPCPTTPDRVSPFLSETMTSPPAAPGDARCSPRRCTRSTHVKTTSRIVDNKESRDRPSRPGDDWHDPHDLIRLLEFCWREARHDYRAAGSPFGPSQGGFELWIQYGERTTVN